MEYKFVSGHARGGVARVLKVNLMEARHDVLFSKQVSLQIEATDS